MIPRIAGRVRVGVVDIAQRSFGERLFGWVDRGVSLVPLVSVRQVATP
jgi:hypothetical protein